MQKTTIGAEQVHRLEVARRGVRGIAGRVVPTYEARQTSEGATATAGPGQTIDGHETAKEATTLRSRPDSVTEASVPIITSLPGARRGLEKEKMKIFDL